MADLSHRNHADMNILRGMVLMVPKESQVRFAANVCGQRLMLGPWWLRAMHWTICKVRGWNPTVTWFLFFERLQRGFPEQVIDDFARHISFGKDASDARSVGGLNQLEVDTTLNLLRHFLKGVDLPTVYVNVLWPPAPQPNVAPQFLSTEDGEFNGNEQLEPDLSALEEIKYLACTAGAPGQMTVPKALARILYLCNRAGVSKKLDELQPLFATTDGRNRNTDIGVSPTPAAPSQHMASARTFTELPMTAFADAAPPRDDFSGEQTILTYNNKVGTWDLAFFESGEEFPENWLGDTHWIDITKMWPGVIAQVALTASEVSET